MKKSKEVLLSRIFIIQCSFVTLIFAVSFFKRYSYLDNIVARADSRIFFGVFLVVGLIGALLEIAHKEIKSRFLNVAGNILEVIVFPSALMAAISLLFLIPIVKWHLPGKIIVYFIMIIFLIGLVPLVYIHIKRAKSLVQRIVLIILFDFAFQISLDQIILLPSKTFRPELEILELILDLGLIWLIGLSMRWWNYKLPDLLKWKVNSGVQLTILIGLFLLWFIVAGISAFSRADSWSQFISHWNFKLQEVPIITIIATITACFIEEWEFRYVLLWQLIRHYRNSKSPVIKPVIISSLLFGIVHSFNLSAKQSIGATLFQVGMAFSVGIFLATIYLYTGIFWIAVLMHSLTDLLSGVLVAGASFTEVTPNLYLIEQFSLICLIILLVSLYLIFEKIEVMKPTLEDIMDMN